MTKRQNPKVMHTLPYISLSVPLFKKEEKHSLYPPPPKKSEPRRETQKKESLQKEAEGPAGYCYIQKASDAKE
jgi:hypothetical protein